jgi:hypothetical protein
MKSMRKRMGGVHNAPGVKRNTCNILVGKIYLKRPLGRLGIEG